MHGIALKAGVSKQTLYHHYANKADLFRTVVENMVNEMLSRLQATVIEDREPREVLTELGQLFLEIIIAPPSVALHRALVTEVPRLPGLGETVYRNGPERAVAILAAYMEKQTAAGHLDVKSPHLAAEHFYGLTLGHCQLRALFCARDDHGSGGISERVAAAVDVFLAAYGRTAAVPGE